MTTITIDDALNHAGAGRYQRRLMAIFGLVWAADAMQVIAVGFTAASIATSFELTRRRRFRRERCFSSACFWAQWDLAGLPIGSAAAAF